MPSKMSLLVALILFTTLLLGAFGSSLVSHTSAQSSATGYSLDNIQTYNPYGQFQVNETLYGSSNATALSSVTFGFPSSYQAHLVALSAYADQGSTTVSTTTSTSVSNNTVEITLSFASSLSGPNATAGLSFWVLDSLIAVNSSGYFVAPVLDSPSISINLTNIYTEVDFPYQDTSVSNTTALTDVGFAQFISVNQATQTWNFTTASPNSTLNAFGVQILSTPYNSGSLDFTSITRQLSIAASGQIIVKDTINLDNLGLNTISELQYTPLSISGNLTAVPANEPPLSNIAPISMSGDVIGLNDTNQEIQPNSAATLIFQYPLASQYWKVSNGVYTITIPTTVPVGGIVDSYKIISTSVPGVKIMGKQLSESATFANETGTGSASLQFRVGIASATADALPIAAILFIGVFVAAVVFRPKPETEGAGSIFDNLVKAVEEKVSSTNELLSELKAKGTSLGRNDLVVTRSRIDEVRSKTNSRIGQIRSQLSSGITTTVQAGINEVLANDREFDRAVRDTLNAYDQLISKKMKEETFNRVQQGNERRLQGQTNSLVDRAHDLVEEYESES